MKKILSFVILNVVVVLQFGCIGNRIFFRNKILIYSSNPEFGQKTSNAEFIDFYKDTINKIDYPFDLFDQEPKFSETNTTSDTTRKKYLLSNLYPYSGVPFKFIRKGKSIYISYTFKGEAFKKKYFQVSKQDSVETSTFDYLCDANVSDNWVTTQFTGDTTIRITGKKIKCWIFFEQYPHLFPPNQRSQTIYIDRKSLLPIQINTTFYRPDRENPSVIKVETFKSRIDSIFSRPWDGSNKKWNYSKCWKSGYSSIGGSH